jgi:DNA polymerase V
MVNSGAQVAEIDVLGQASQFNLPCSRPLLGPAVRAGFPSPADDYIEEWLDLNELLVGEEKEAVYFVRARGQSMIDAGIRPGDILVVNRARNAIDDDIVIAAVDGALTVKRLFKRAGVVQLHAANPKFKIIELEEGQDLHIWGVVTSCIHQFRK